MLYLVTLCGFECRPSMNFVCRASSLSDCTFRRRQEVFNMQKHSRGIAACIGLVASFAMRRRGLVGRGPLDVASKRGVARYHRRIFSC